MRGRNIYWSGKNSKKEVDNCDNTVAIFTCKWASWWAKRRSPTSDYFLFYSSTYSLVCNVSTWSYSERRFNERTTQEDQYDWISNI